MGIPDARRLLAAGSVILKRRGRSFPQGDLASELTDTGSLWFGGSRRSDTLPDQQRVIFKELVNQNPIKKAVSWGGAASVSVRFFPRDTSICPNCTSVILIR